MRGIIILTFSIFSLFTSNIYSQIPNDGCGVISTVNQTASDVNGNTVVLEYDIASSSNNIVAVLAGIDSSYSTNSAYNTSTGYLYLGKGNHLMVYDVQNSYTLLGRIDLIGNSSSLSNNLFSKDNMIGYVQNKTLTIIDVSTTTSFPATISSDLITEVTLSESLSGVNDFVRIDDFLYGMKGYVLYVVEVYTGIVTTRNLTLDDSLDSSAAGESYGACWQDREDNFYCFNNDNGDMYRIEDITSGTTLLTKILLSSPSGSNDGFGCENMTNLTDTDGDSDPDTTDPDDDNDGNPDVTDPNPLFAVANDDYMESIANYASEVNIITNDDFEVSSLLNVIFEESQYLGEMSFDHATGIFSYTPTLEEEDSEIDIDYEACHNGVCARATIHIIVGRDTDGDSDPDTTDPDDDNDGNPDVTDPNPLFAVANDDYMESIANYASEVNIITNDDFEVSSLLNVIFEESQYLGEMSFDNATGIFSYTPTVEEEDSEIDIDYEVCHNGICARATIHIIVGKDTDGDGISDEYDPDIDNDGTDNEDDENPLFAVANDDYSYAIAETAKIIDIITNDDFSISSSLIIYSDNLGSAQGNIYFDSTDGTLSYTAIISEINSEVTVNYTVCNISTNVCAEAVVYITIKEDVGEGAVNQLFTPNGDGVNDLFVIEGIEEIYPYYNMIVFNRYGNTVYEYSHNGNKELSPVWWDGTVSNSIHSKGEKGPPGVYFYLINYGVKGKIPLKGWVYLDE